MRWSRTHSKLEIILLDDCIKTEEDTFRIKTIPRVSDAINGLTHNQSMILMSKKEHKSVTILINFPKDFLYDLKINLKQFVVRFPDKKILVIEGAKFTIKVNKIIQNLPLRSIFENQYLSSDIDCDNCHFPYVVPIKIIIIDDKNYHEYEK